MTEKEQSPEEQIANLFETNILKPANLELNQDLRIQEDKLVEALKNRKENLGQLRESMDAYLDLLELTWQSLETEDEQNIGQIKSYVRLAKTRLSAGDSENALEDLIEAEMAASMLPVKEQLEKELTALTNNIRELLELLRGRLTKNSNLRES